MKFTYIEKLTKFLNEFLVDRSLMKIAGQESNNPPFYLLI